MNPEEGDLRPQILDRFPLSVTIKTVTDPQQRVEIVKRNLMFESDPDRFLEVFRRSSEQLKAWIMEARERLPEIVIDEESLLAIASACGELKVDGQRPDIVIVKLARSTAALERRSTVAMKDILLGAVLTLAHRTRDGGLLGPPSEEDIETVFRKHVKKTAGDRGPVFQPEDAFNRLSDAAAVTHFDLSDTGGEKKNMK